MKKAALPQGINRETASNSSAMLLQAPLLAEIPWLVHGFSTRRGGTSSFINLRGRNDLNLGKVPWDSPRHVAENRRRLLAELGVPDFTGDMKLVVLRQIHSDLIRHVESSIPITGDALITNRPGILLSILAADCLPILIVDIQQKAAAAVHCGWRGTARRLPEKVVGRMRMIFDSQPRDLRAAIGPGIRACCYKVGPEVKEEFEGQFLYASKLFVYRNEPPSPLEEKFPRLFKTYKSPGYKTFHDPDGENRQMYLDLVLANVNQLRDAGLAWDHIYADSPCTSCHPDLFFSHRRDAGRTGRMMGVIGIRAK